MIISKNSWHYRLLKFSYGNWGIPKNLCPYFWKLVVTIFATIIFSVFNIWGHKIIKDKSIDEGFISFTNFVVGSLCWVVCLILFVMGAVFFTTDQKLKETGYCLWIITIFVGVSLGSMTLYDYIKSKRTHKIKPPSLVKEFLKAKKNKYCPKIDFKD